MRNSNKHGIRKKIRMPLFSIQKIQEFKKNTHTHFRIAAIKLIFSERFLFFAAMLCKHLFYISVLSFTPTHCTDINRSSSIIYCTRSSIKVEINCHIDRYKCTMMHVWWSEIAPRKRTSVSLSLYVDKWIIIQ